MSQKYIFCVRAIPVTQVQTSENGHMRDPVSGERLLPYEVHTPEDLKAPPFKYLQLRLNHNNKEYAVIGKTIAQWPESDGSLLVIGVVDDTTLAGAIAQSDIKRGLLTGASISYRINVFADQEGIVKTEREYLELSLTAQPDRKDDRCNILFGATESELNLKAEEYIKRLEPATTESVTDTSKGSVAISELLAKISKHTIKGPEVGDSKQATVQEMSQPPPPQVVPNTPQQQQQPPGTPQQVGNFQPPPTQQAVPHTGGDFIAKVAALSKTDPSGLGEGIKGLSKEELESAVLFMANKFEEQRTNTSQSAWPPNSTPTASTQRPLTNEEIIMKQAEEMASKKYEQKVRELEAKTKEMEDYAKKTQLAAYEEMRDKWLDSAAQITASDSPDNAGVQKIKTEFDKFGADFAANPAMGQSALPLMNKMTEVLAYSAKNARENQEIKKKYLYLESQYGAKQQDVSLKESLRQSILHGPIRRESMTERNSPYGQHMDTHNPYAPPPQQQPSVYSSSFAYGQQSTVSQPTVQQKPQISTLKDRDFAKSILEGMNAPINQNELAGFKTLTNWTIPK